MVTVKSKKRGKWAHPNEHLIYCADLQIDKLIKDKTKYVYSKVQPIFIV